MWTIANIGESSGVMVYIVSGFEKRVVWNKNIGERNDVMVNTTRYTDRYRRNLVSHMSCSILKLNKRKSCP